MILAPPTRRFAEIETSLGTLRIRSLNDREKCQIDASSFDASGKIRKDQMILRNAKLIAAMVVDAEGNLLFGAEDVRRIQELECGVVGRIVEACENHLADGESKNDDATLIDDLR